MSFAAMATWQALLVVGIAVAAAVVLFRLKLKPPQILVPSLTLWRRVLDENRERSLWERIRRAVSLALVVLITLAIALALLRPQVTDTVRRANLQVGQPGSRVSIVVDSSWSMLAETTNGQTRWDRAIARARSLAAGAGGEEVVLSTTADGVVEGPTPDVALIEAALDRIAPSGGDATAWPRVEGARTTYFLTDGAVARPLESDVTVESVFEAADNVAITAFDVRPAATLESAGQAFLEVANYSAASQDVRIVLTRGQVPVLDVTTTLAPGAAVQRVVPLSRGGEARVRARISAKSNALVVDDEAVAWIPGAQPINVTVVSDQAASFGPLFSQDPAITPTFVSSKAYKPTGTEQIVIFDRTLPAARPTVPVLYIAPPGNVAVDRAAVPATDLQGRRSSAVDEREPQWASGPWHPILDGVDTLTMALDKARVYAADGLTAIALTGQKTPLILVRDTADQRLAVFTFSVTDSKLMFAPAFPVLLGNTLEWLAHPTSGGTRRPGPAIFPGSLFAISGPDGRPVPVTSVDGVSIAMLSRVGFYEATAGGARSVIAVNAGDPDTSNLQRTRLAAATTAGASSTPSRGRPWWLLALTAAIFLIAAEWFTWQRRITV